MSVENKAKPEIRRVFDFASFGPDSLRMRLHIWNTLEVTAGSDGSIQGVTMKKYEGSAASPPL